MGNESLQQRIVRAATRIDATEMAVFVVDRHSRGAQLHPLLHVRPDDADIETRRFAIQAFANLITPCIEQGHDNTIEVDAGNEQQLPQYCLITLAWDQQTVAGAAGFIIRRPCLQDARMALNVLHDELKASI